MRESYESDIGFELRAYADRGPRAFDAMAITRAAMHTHRGSTVTAWTTRPAVVAAAVMLALAIIGGFAVAAGAFAPMRKPFVEEPATVAPTRSAGTLGSPVPAALPNGGGVLTVTPAPKFDVVPDGGVRLADGRVLVVGYVDDGTPSALLWDPATGRATVTGSPALRHTLGASAPLRDGSALLAGGSLGSERTGVDLTEYGLFAERYDLATNTFRFTSRMTATHGVCGCRAAWPRPFAILLRDGRVLIAGGVEPGDTQAGANVEIYDPVTDLFTAVGAVGTYPMQLVGVLLDDGRVLLKSIDRAWFVDPGLPSIADAPSTTTTSDRFATLLPDGRVLFTGAGTSTGRAAGATGRATDAEIYDPALRMFRALPGQPNPPGTHMGVSAMLRDGRVVFMSKEATWVFDPSTNRSTEVSVHPPRPFEPALAVTLDDGRILIVADDGRVVLADV